MAADTFIRRPQMSVVISVVIMLAGGICAFMLPISEYPSITPPTIQVTALYPGASAEVIANTVAAPLESEINGVENLAYYSSKSDISGNYTLTITFETDADEDMALVNTNNAVKRAEQLLPAEVVNEGVAVVKSSPDLIAMLTFTSSNPEHDEIFLSNYVDINIKDTVTRVGGVGQVVIFGEMKYSMRVWLDPHKMRAMDISYAEVANAIETQNVQAATGSVGTEFSSKHMQFKVDTQGRLSTPEEFAEVIVRSGRKGRQVRLGDIAGIELGSENYRGSGSLDGSKAVLMAIYKLNEANALELFDNVKKVVGDLSADFPEGMAWGVGYDSTEFVKVSMAEIASTLVLTLILVVIITYVFLQDWRATLVPTVAIPVSLVGTFLCLYLFGMSINTLSMFALILVIGSVVDNAICVVESCMRLMQEEKLTPFDAAVKTMEQLSGALIAATMVVVAVYMPIGFYGGMVGRIYKEFAVTMCVALIISTVVAMTLSPAMCAVILREPTEPKGFFGFFNRALDFTINRYVNVGGFLARRLVLTGAVMLAILVANIKAFQSIPSAFVPSEDKGVVFCEVVLPPSAALQRTEAVLTEMYHLVKDIPGIEQVLYAPGQTITAGQGENMGIVILDLDSWSLRATPELHVDAIRDEVVRRCATIPEAAVTVFTPPAIMGLGATGGVTFSLMATGTQTSRDIAQAINQMLAKVMETDKALYCFTSFDANTPMINLKLDRAKSQALDVPVKSVFNTLQTQLGSYYVNDINLFSKTYKVKVQSVSGFRENINALGQLSVTSDSGTSVPLSAVATFDWTLGPRQTERFNMFQSAWANVQSKPYVSSGEMMQTVQDIVRNDLPSDYQIGWTDMSYQESQNEGKIVYLLLISFTLAYLFLVAQYESWTMPISVILSVATATLGGMIALKVYGKSMDIYCQLGLLMLIGLMAKSAILMVEYSKQERDNGVEVIDAALNGLRMRFRSVMMTGLSFVIGVFPMVFASGAGSASRQAIGQTTFWGMIVAMIAGIMIIPGLYVMFQRFSEFGLRWMHKTFGKKRRRNYSRRFVAKN